MMVRRTPMRPLLLAGLVFVLLAVVDNAQARPLDALDPSKPSKAPVPTFVNAGLAGQIPLNTTAVGLHNLAVKNDTSAQVVAPPVNGTAVSAEETNPSAAPKKTDPATGRSDSARLSNETVVHSHVDVPSSDTNTFVPSANATQHDAASNLTSLSTDTLHNDTVKNGTESEVKSDVPNDVLKADNATVASNTTPQHSSTTAFLTTKAVASGANQTKSAAHVARYDEATKQTKLPTLSMPASDVDVSTNSTVAPYLAETDTLYSMDSQRGYGPAPYEVRYRELGDVDDKFDVLKHWGNFAPYFSSPDHAEMKRLAALPRHCSVKQVHLLHRHGARLPKADGTESVDVFKTWYEAATSSDPGKNYGTKATFDGPLSFLATWQHVLGTNKLTAAGFQQMFDSGIQAHYRYGGLRDSKQVKHKPVVRVTSKERVIDSAKFWALGFYGADAEQLIETEVLIDQEGFNSTLSVQESCPAVKLELSGTKMKEQWIEKYMERAVKRLQHHVHGATLSPQIVFGMQSMCPFETYALGISEFCHLFSKQEWEGFEYASDLEFQGDYGFMSKTGLAQGIGWAQELVARLKGEKVSTPFTSQNTTLDSDVKQFPLDQAFYADFTHGRQLMSVLTALNFTTFATKLDPTSPDPARNFIISHITPSAARLYLEVLECDERKKSSGDASRRYIRAILNDALLPMSADQGCVGHNSLRDGLCPLEKFIDHIEKVSVPAVNYKETCFGPHATPPTAAGNNTAVTDASQQN